MGQKERWIIRLQAVIKEKFAKQNNDSFVYLYSSMEEKRGHC